MPKKVCIIHGWAEGSWQSQGFANELRKRGFQLTNDATKADVVIAHSAGCFFVPTDIPAKAVMLIGLPFWPGKSLLGSLVEKLQLEANRHQKRSDRFWFLSKLAHNTWYIVTKPQSSWRFFKNHRNLNLPQAKPGQRVILVRNKNDRFCTPRVTDLLPHAKHYQFIELPGIHDDCWLDPKPYVDLILREYN